MKGKVISFFLIFSHFFRSLLFLNTHICTIHMQTVEQREIHMPIIHIQCMFLRKIRYNRYNIFRYFSISTCWDFIVQDPL